MLEGRSSGRVQTRTRCLTQILSSAGRTHADTANTRARPRCDSLTRSSPHTAHTGQEEALRHLHAHTARAPNYVLSSCVSSPQRSLVQTHSTEVKTEAVLTRSRNCTFGYTTIVLCRLISSPTMPKCRQASSARALAQDRPVPGPVPACAGPLLSAPVAAIRAVLGRRILLLPTVLGVLPLVARSRESWAPASRDAGACSCLSMPPRRCATTPNPSAATSHPTCEVGQSTGPSVSPALPPPRPAREASDEASPAGSPPLLCLASAPQAQWALLLLPARSHRRRGGALSGRFLRLRHVLDRLRRSQHRCHRCQGRGLSRDRGHA